MNRTAQGWLLLAAGVAALFFWWRRREDRAAAPAGDVSNALETGGQVGSNFYSELTPALVESAFDFAQRQIDESNCFRMDGYTGPLGGPTQWRNGRGQTEIMPPGEIHPQACRII